MSGTTHLCPQDGNGLLPCCGQTQFEVPRTDRITADLALVTCGTPFAETCDARYNDVTSIMCHRAKGHRGDHEGTEVVAWVQDDRYCTTHGRAHWDDGDRTCQWTDEPASAPSRPGESDAR